MKQKKRSISRAKLKVANQDERLQKWKEHFKNLPGNPPDINDKHSEKISNIQLDIKLGQFTELELDSVREKH